MPSFLSRITNLAVIKDTKGGLDLGNLTMADIVDGAGREGEQ